MSPPSSITLPPSAVPGPRLQVPSRTASLSGLIPFAQGFSPNPRKVTGSQSQATFDRIDPSLLASSTMNSEIAEDEKYGSVRHKRPDRCRLLKRTLSNSGKHQPPPIDGDLISDHQDDPKQFDAEYPRYFSSSVDRPSSANTVKSHLPTNGREWSETISMHTSSSDTIGVHDRSAVLRNSSRNLSASNRALSTRSGGSHSDEDENGFSNYHPTKEESMITPVKTRRSDSFQKTLQRANSVSEMLPASSAHDEVASVAWTPRATTSARHRRISSGARRTMLAPTENVSSTDLSPKQSNPASSLSNSQGTSRSPQSHASLSRLSRPGIPDNFVHSRHPDLADSEFHRTAETRRSELQSSISPRSNRTQPMHSANHSHQIATDGVTYRHSDTFAPVPDRVNGVESALSRYDGHHSLSDRHKYLSSRSKHASWSVLEDLGKDLTRSQSVLGGTYDPRITQSRQVAIRPRTSHMSPLSRRFATHRSNGLEDEDDDQTSTTTYTHIQSMPRKPSSADSRSRTSEWGFEDQEFRNRSVQSASRLGGRINSLHASPSQRKSTMEKDRTLRGNGSAVLPTLKPFTQLLKNAQHEKNSASHNNDSLSSSSGTTTSKRPQSHGSLNHQPSPSARLNVGANRHSRPPTRSASLAAIGLTALLSPTPTVDHHSLLINAYEALESPQGEQTKEARDLQSALNGLLSSVVKNSCKIDATLAQLNESSLNHQVEMELADDYIDNKHTDNLLTKQSSSENVTRQKYFMMKDSLAHMAKVQGQLVRTSNDQIRDLTEVLICLSKLDRMPRESTISRQTGVITPRFPASDDPRDFYSHVENNSKDFVRSGSRAGAGYSRSHSPSKLRHTIDLSPLSVISSRDGSPLSKTKSNSNVPSPHSPVSHPQRFSASTTSPRSLHNRASTISFAHQRYLSIDGLPPQLVRAQKRTSALSCNSIIQMRDAPPHPRRSNSPSNVVIDEFGLYCKSSDPALRSPVEFKYPNQRESRSKTENARDTIRGCQPSAVFPKTPPRVATSSLSQATAHSHVSPTRPHHGSIGNRSQSIDRDFDHVARPPSSMSTILDRAHHTLSRTEHYSTVSTISSARKENGSLSQRYSKGTVVEDSRLPSNRNARTGRMSVAEVTMDHEHGFKVRPDGRRQDEEQKRCGPTATAALERFNPNRAGTWNVGGYHHHSEPQHDSEVRKVSGSTSVMTSRHLPSSGSTSTSNHSRDSVEVDSNVDLRKDSMDRSSQASFVSNTQSQSHRRSRKESIQKLFGGLKRNNYVNPHLKS